jgi:hypothetical protein
MRKLQSKTNVAAPSAGYPFGRIKDNPGNRTGTPVNEEVYGDFHVVFDKLLNLAGITPNDLPENDYSGYQAIEALLKRFVSSPQNLGLKTKVMNIGAWDMNAGNRQFQHGLDWRKIVSVEVLIYNDINTVAEPLIKADQLTGIVAGSWELDNLNIILKATQGEPYQTAGAWNDVTLNRGIVVFKYTD